LKYILNNQLVRHFSPYGPDLFRLPSPSVSRLEFGQAAETLKVIRSTLQGTLLTTKVPSVFPRVARPAQPAKGIREFLQFRDTRWLRHAKHFECYPGIPTKMDAAKMRESEAREVFIN